MESKKTPVPLPSWAVAPHSCNIGMGWDTLFLLKQQQDNEAIGWARGVIHALPVLPCHSPTRANLTWAEAPFLRAPKFSRLTPF